MREKQIKTLVARIEEQASPSYFPSSFSSCFCFSFFVALFFFFFFVLFFFFFFFFFFALLLAPALVLLSLRHPPPEKYAKGGPPRRMKKTVTSRGERIPRHHVLLGTRRGAGESEPRNSRNRYFRFSTSVSHFALRFRRFRESATKNGGQLSTRIAVELLTGPSFGVFNSYCLVQVCLFLTLFVKKLSK